MTLSRRRFIAISASAAVVGSLGFRPSGDAARWQGVALGAHADIRLHGFREARARDLLARSRGEILRLEQLFSLYLPDSSLSRLNRAGRLAAPAPDLLALASTITTVHRATGGLFDPTVQPLWDVHARSMGAPASDDVAKARQTVGWNRVSTTPAEIVLPPGGALTLNGIAQGYITDRIVDLLRANGVRNAVVEIGEISAIGRPETASAWTVHLEGRGAAEMVSNQAIATTAPAGTRLGPGGESHVIDPVLGAPARSDWSTTTVIHRSAAMADGLSTAAALMDIAGVRLMLDRVGDIIFTGEHHRLGRVRATA